MLRKLLIVAVVVALLPAGAFATPTLTSYTGTGADGTSLTITGTSFGTKGVAAPMKYDDFGSGTPGQNIGNGWSLNSAANCGHTGLMPQYSTTVVRTNSINSAKCRFDESLDPNCADAGGAEDGAYYSSNFGLASVPSPGFKNGIYVDAWVYSALATPEPRNWKLLRIHTVATDDGRGPSAWTPNDYINLYCPTNSDGLRFGQDMDGSHQGYVYDNRDCCNCSGRTGDCLKPWHGASWWKNNWRHIQLWMKESDVSVANGQLRLSTDQVVDPNKTTFLNRTDATYWDTIYFGNYVGHGTDGICTQKSTGNTDIYWSSVYVDSTQAHVVIGDAATFTACTHTEIQIPTAWTTTSITVTTHRGSFTAVQGNWLYVMDRFGAVNPNGLLIPNLADSTKSYFVPQAGPLNSPNTLEGPAAIAYAVTCPNNDLLNNLSRLKVVLLSSTGAPVVGVPANQIYVQFNGGTVGQGFTGAGDDSIYANSTYEVLAGCPDLRFIYADNATDATGTTYIYWKGAGGVRDASRKWGMFAGDIPVYAQGMHLQGRLTTLSANGTYTAHVKNIDTVGAESTNAGEVVNILDLNPILAAIGSGYDYRYDFDNDGDVDLDDYNFARQHTNHRCNYPLKP